MSCFYIATRLTLLIQIRHGQEGCARPTNVHVLVAEYIQAVLQKNIRPCEILLAISFGLATPPIIVYRVAYPREIMNTGTTCAVARRVADSWWAHDEGRLGASFCFVRALQA